MSSENRGNGPPQTVPICTLYPGGYQGNVNYGFHHSQPEISPPKYEDVVNGRTATSVTQPHGTYEVPEQAAIYILPVKHTAAQKTLGLIFIILFLIGFVSVLIKILSFS